MLRRPESPAFGRIQEIPQWCAQTWSFAESSDPAKPNRSLLHATGLPVTLPAHEWLSLAGDCATLRPLLYLIRQRPGAARRRPRLLSAGDLRVRIVILGCGRVGSTLATILTREGHTVCVIDRDQGAFDKAAQRLGPDFTGETVRGIGIDEDTLRQAGVEEADAFISVTSGDNTNIVAAQIAQERFHVPKVLARVYDPIRAEAYRKAGIETICTTTLTAGLMHDRLLGRPLRSLHEYLEATTQGSSNTVGD